MNLLAEISIAVVFVACGSLAGLLQPNVQGCEVEPEEGETQRVALRGI